MDKYTVKLTNQAKEQIANTIDYIAHQLNAPTTAINFSNLIENELIKLDSMPESHALVME